MGLRYITINFDAFLMLYETERLDLTEKLDYLKIVLSIKKERADRAP